MRAGEVGRVPLRQGPGEWGVGPADGDEGSSQTWPSRGGTGPQAPSPARFGPSVAGRGARADSAKPQYPGRARRAGKGWAQTATPRRLCSPRANRDEGAGTHCGPAGARWGGASEGALRADWLEGRGRGSGGRAQGRLAGGFPELWRARAGAAVMEETGGGFRKDLVSKLLQLHFTDGKTKVSGDALWLMAELLTIFVVETAVRSIRQAQAEDLALVDVDQLEKVLPQLLLDF
ncbi:centromere protein X [Ursus americanus]|nr:centromere protein X [Ursus americanus]